MDLLIMAVVFVIFLTPKRFLDPQLMPFLVVQVKTCSAGSIIGSLAS